MVGGNGLHFMILRTYVCHVYIYTAFLLAGAALRYVSGTCVSLVHVLTILHRRTCHDICMQVSYVRPMIELL